MERKERYVSYEEKKTLRKDNKWAKFGKSLLKGAALTVGGFTVAAASAALGFAAGVYVTAGAIFLIGRPIFTNVVTDFVGLFQKEKSDVKEM